MPLRRRRATIATRPRSSADRVSASGAEGTGSSPVGGTRCFRCYPQETTVRRNSRRTTPRGAGLTAAGTHGPILNRALRRSGHLSGSTPGFRRPRAGSRRPRHGPRARGFRLSPVRTAQPLWFDAGRAQEHVDRGICRRRPVAGATASTNAANEHDMFRTLAAGARPHDVRLRFEPRCLQPCRKRGVAAYRPDCERSRAP